MTPASDSGRLDVYPLKLHALKLTASLGLVAGLLLATDGLIKLCHYRWREVPWLVRRLFDVDEEMNFPTWYSSVLLLLACGLLLLVYKRKAAQGAPGATAWLILSVGFLGLSIDEVAGVHDTLNAVTRSSWAIPAGAVAIGIGLLYSRFLLSLPWRTGVLFVTGGLLFLGGAVGVELHTDWYNDINYTDSLPYALWTLVEEGLEMFGVIVFIYALAAYMRGDGARAEVAVEPDPPGPS